MYYDAKQKQESNIKKYHNAASDFYRRKHGVSSKNKIRYDLKPKEHNMALSINLKKKRQISYGALDALKVLQNDFKKCFKIRDKQPLKIKILDDIVEHYNKSKPLKYIKPSVFKKAICIYTQSIPYLRAHVEGANRIDLQGNNVGQVTEKEALYALECLKYKLAALTDPNNVDNANKPKKHILRLKRR